MHPDSRAVTPLYQVFGGQPESAPADARQLGGDRDMHPGEHAFYSALVPLTLWAALASWVGWLVAFPLTFFVLTTLPLLLPVTNRTAQWLVWLGAGFWWAIVYRETAGVIGWVAHVWLVLGVMNLAASTVLAWRGLMRIPGKWGIATRLLLIIAVHGAAFAIGVKYGWIWLLPTGLFIGGFFCTAILRPGSCLLGKVIRTTESGEILLTIDDGPDPRDTPLLLDLLDRHGTKAVFFMIGEKVLAHPELVREVLRRGHEIGNHTLTHPQASFWCAGPWRTWREIAGCQAAVHEVAGISPRYFRAPVGHRNLFTHPVCRALGLQVMAWNRRGYDAVGLDAEKVLDRIVPRLAPGDIVLLHEATPIAPAVLGGVLAHISPPRR